mmetsp:Transcript_4687/g.5023  ORF Transcript_4687/g.5023 Transcript_4687/m.5023 type:complete len:131 (-) Transcript_4687:353-745(-)
MPDIVTCTDGGDGTTTTTDNYFLRSEMEEGLHDGEDDDYEYYVNLLLVRRLWRATKEELLFQLTVPSSLSLSQEEEKEEEKEEDECSGRTSNTTASSFSLSQEVVYLSPRIRMFYHDANDREAEEEKRKK